MEVRNPVVPIKFGFKKPNTPRRQPLGFAVTVLQAGHQIFSQGDCSEVCGSPKAHKANCDPYPKGSRFTKRSHRWSLNPADIQAQPLVEGNTARAKWLGRSQRKRQLEAVEELFPL